MGEGSFDSPGWRFDSMNPTLRLPISRFSLVSLILFPLFLACGGGGGGQSPTEPTDVRRLALEFRIEHADGSATLERVEIALDGSVIGTATSDPSPFQSGHFERPSGPGNHVLRATVIEQTASPSPYRLSATGTWGTTPVSFGPVSANLETGQSMELSFGL